MINVHLRLKLWFQEPVERMRKQYNKKQKITESFEKGDVVMLNGRNI